MSEVGVSEIKEVDMSQGCSWGIQPKNRLSNGPKVKLSKTEEVQILHMTKSVITENQESFFTEKHFTSQEVFHIKILKLREIANKI